MSDVTPVSRTTIAWSLALSTIGLALSAYLTYAHFQKLVLSCPANGVFNCEVVTHSAESHLLGVPVAVLGLANYLVMTALCTPAAWRRPERIVAFGRGALAVASIVMVLWLVAAELLIIGKFCLWCTAVHLVTFALFVVLARAVPRQLGWVD